MKRILSSQLRKNAVGILAIAAFGVVVGTANQAYAGDTSFKCAVSNGYPKTLATTVDGKRIPLIRSETRVAEISQQQRCQVVSRRFQKNYDNGNLKDITTGALNGQPVMCAASRINSACTNGTLLFTLKPGSNPNEVLKQLLDKRGFSAGRVLSESDDETINVDFDKYLRGVEASTQPSD